LAELWVEAESGPKNENGYERAEGREYCMFKKSSYRGMKKRFEENHHQPPRNKRHGFVQVLEV
jgi:hypothetical protein